MLVSVIIPVYNEERTLEAIIGKVQSALLTSGLEKEIIIVDDGSTDKTSEILGRFKNIRGMTILSQPNQGKTGALLTGMKVAKGDIFLVQDADLEYDPVEYPRLLDPIVTGQTQVVYGSRFLGNIQNMEPINRFANQISNWTIKTLYGVKLTDINTCYKVFTRRAFEGISIKGKKFSLDTELTVKLLLKGFGIKEIPIGYVARSRAQGKKMKWSTALEMYWPIIKYRFCRS
jgi:glycosyltransferase involved in cell wall biosynthesis